MPTLNYDKQYDTLYIGAADNSNSYGSEQNGCLNVFRDVETDAITGYVVFGFCDNYERRALPPITEPFCVDYDKDVMPFVQASAHLPFAVAI